MKRIFDFVIALSGLILLFPLFLLVGILIYFTDGWPVIFKQKRIGKNRTPFQFFKFRSMRVSGSGQTEEFGAGDSSRVTPFGKFLRRTKLDELPQLINVVKGDMSLVGPRPEVGKWVNVYPERWAKVLSVRPGITDHAALAFRHEEDILAKAADPEKTYREVLLPQKLDLYEAYVDQHSLASDMVLVLKTIYCLIIRK